MSDRNQQSQPNAGNEQNAHDNAGTQPGGTAHNPKWQEDDEQFNERNNVDSSHGRDIDEDLDREFNRQSEPDKEHGDTTPGTLTHR